MFKFICTIQKKVLTLQRQTKKLTIMAQLTKTQAIKAIYHLAKAISEVNKSILGTTKTEIEMNLNDCYSGQIIYISNFDGQIMTIKPVFESRYIKMKILIINGNQFSLDII